MDIWGWHLSEPLYLWFLLLPGVFWLIWGGRLVQRRKEVGRFLNLRTVPLKEKFSFFGSWLFWLFLVGALACLILALARPQKLISVVQTGGVDLIIIQDGSASMGTKDVQPSRWERAMEWAGSLVEVLDWNGDRVALTLFAHWAVPQVRFSRDPNVLLFFLDHLRSHSPILLEDNTAWDTNLEEGIYWALKMSEKDKQTAGASSNGQAFIVVSDGQVWSGRVAQALTVARKMNIPVYAIGVGTTAGARIPYDPKTIFEREQNKDLLNIHSAIDRISLQNIAREGGGKYFELNRESDREIALEIVRETRAKAGNKKGEKVFADLYWYFLCLAAALLGLAILSIKEKIELVMLGMVAAVSTVGLVVWIK